MESALLAAQQAAIQEVRARYERGELDFEDFRHALDALVEASSVEECRTILRELPVSPLAPLAALERRTPPPAPALSHAQQRIGAFMGQTKKLRRSWKLQPQARVSAFMGEVQLDLNLADIPQQAQIHVSAVMGTVKIYAPQSAHVIVHTRALLSDTNALGEGVSGVIASGHEEHYPANGVATSQITIDVFALMSDVKIILADGPTISIGEVARDMARTILSGVQRGLQQRATQRSFSSSNTPRELSSHE
ncbi:MAG: LiaF domain-containing protein [Ktedonobacterales bacterium]